MFHWISLVLTLTMMMSDDTRVMGRGVGRRGCNLPRMYKLCSCNKDETWLGCWDENLRRLPQIEREMFSIERLTMTGCNIGFIYDDELDHFPNLVTLDVRGQLNVKCVKFIGDNPRNVTMLGICLDEIAPATTEDMMTVDSTSSTRSTTSSTTTTKATTRRSTIKTDPRTSTTMKSSTSTATLTSSTTSTVKRPAPTKKWPIVGPATNDNTTTDQPNCTTTTNIPIPDDDDDDTNHWEIAWMIGGIIGSIGTLAMIIKIMIELKEHYSCKGGKCRCDFCWRLGTCFWDCLKRNPNKKKESPRPIRNPIYTGPASSRRNRRIRSQQVQRTRATGVVGFSSSLSDCREGDTVLELRGDDENEVTSSDEDTNIDTLEPLRGPFDDIRDPFREPFTDDFWFTEDDTDEDKDRIEIA